MKKRFCFVLALIVAWMCGTTASAIKIKKLPNVLFPSLIDFGSDFLTVKEERSDGVLFNYYRVEGSDAAICDIIPEYLAKLDSRSAFTVDDVEYTNQGWEIYTIHYSGDGVNFFRISNDQEGWATQGEMIIVCKIGTFELYVAKGLIFADTGVRTAYVDDTEPEEDDGSYDSGGSSGSGGGHWETHTVTVKCSYCHGTGRCRICNGSGIRPSTINGNSMSCTPYCVYCSGTGTMVSSEQVYVYD